MFNALTVSGLRAPQTSDVTTTALFAPLDPSRQPNRKDILQLRRSAIALAFPPMEQPKDTLASLCRDPLTV